MQLPTAAQMREADRQAIEGHRIPSLFLMENAGQGAFQIIEKYYSPLKDQRVLVVVGKGNNGGDGLVVARYLAQHAVPVTIVLLMPANQLKGDALINYERLVANRRLKKHFQIKEMTDESSLSTLQKEASASTLIVDAILGTGLADPVTGFFAAVIQGLNDSGRPIVALDIPSGLDADRGVPLGEAIRAQHTVAFGLPKIGEVFRHALDWVGGLHVVDIGIPKEVVSSLHIEVSWVMEREIVPHLPVRKPQTHKGTYGHVLVVAGSVNKLGAALLTAKAALRTGAGLVTLALPELAFEKIPSDFLEVMYEPVPSTPEGLFSETALPKILEIMEGKSVVAVGPGMGMDRGTEALVQGLVKGSTIPLIIDADGLNNLAGGLTSLKKARAPIILTPHPGEMSRLSQRGVQEIQKDRLKTVQDWVRQYPTYLVLKGDQTLVATPEGEIYINSTGNAAMATAGMGDVLTGIIAALMAQKIPLKEAVVSGVYIHGCAGDLFFEEKGDRGLLASEILDNLPRVIRKIQAGVPKFKNSHNCNLGSGEK